VDRGGQVDAERGGGHERCDRDIRELGGDGGQVTGGTGEVEIASRGLHELAGFLGERERLADAFLFRAESGEQLGAELGGERGQVEWQGSGGHAAKSVRSWRSRHQLDVVPGSSGRERFWHAEWVTGRAWAPGPTLMVPSPVVELTDERLAGIRLILKRDDLIHPDLPGNKWRKLSGNLAAAAEQGAETLLTFGGAYSNHIAATAAAGWHFGFRTVGVIRGEEHLPLNPVLARASERHGMRLTYLDRTRYRAKREPALLAELTVELGPFYLLPEGGSNALAAVGCAQLGAEIVGQVPAVDVVVCPVGTGGTLAGLAAGIGPNREAIGVSVLKGGAFLTDEVATLQHAAFGHLTDNWRIADEFHFGGYARRTPDLNAFMDDFATRHGLILEWIYVAKMMYGLFAMVADGRIPPGSTVAALITGRCEDVVSPR
jgi:1-aminocyclopropane-1-carboxylate deaminase